MRKIRFIKTLSSDVLAKEEVSPHPHPQILTFEILLSLKVKGLWVVFVEKAM